MGNVVPFTGDYYNREKRAEIICEEVASLISEKLRKEHSFNTSSNEFLTNLGWLLKFIEVTVHDELGISNELSRELKMGTKK